MKRRKLTLSKNKVFIFNLYSAFDKANGNTYKAFGKCYYIQNNKRHYFRDFNLMIDEDFITFYDYQDAYATVRQWLKDVHNININFMSEHHNIVVFEKDVSSYRELKRLAS